MDITNLLIEDISRNHNREIFSCGIAALDNYLKYDARRHHVEGLNHTKILSDKNNNVIIGYVSFAAASINSNTFINKKITKSKNYDIPCLKITRFAIDLRFQRQGIGQFLLFSALKHACTVSETIGILAVIIDTKNEKAKRFYLDNGFYVLQEKIVYVPISELQKKFKEFHVNL